MFDIILPSPFVLGVKDPEDGRLGCAIEAVFPSLDDYITMVWNEMPIYLSCRYDVSIVTNDIVRIVNELLKGYDVDFQNSWPSNTFYAIWNIVSCGEKVTIVADWINVFGDEDALNEKNEVAIDKKELIHKLCIILNFVSQGVDKVGYTTNELEDYHNLLDVLIRARGFSN